MSFTKYTLGAAAVVFVLGATAASAVTERVTTADCIKAAGQVRAAIEANQQSTNLKAAKQQQTAGSYYCQSGMFAKGVDFYNQALTLLAQK
jgi:hypothetical protein